MTKTSFALRLRAAALSLMALVAGCSSSDEAGQGPANGGAQADGGASQRGVGTAPADPWAPVTFVGTPEMKAAFAFVRDKMRNPEHGVRLSFVDSSSATDEYPVGWSTSAEDQGLLMLAAAAMNERAVFDETLDYVMKRLASPRHGVMSAGYLTHAKKSWELADEQGVLWQIASPHEDLRIARGLIAGWTVWRDERYRDAAIKLSHGLVRATVATGENFPEFAGGLVTAGCLFREDTAQVNLASWLVPLHFADLWTMEWLAHREARWASSLIASLQMMEKGQIASSGQFHNSFLQDGYVYDGSYEFRDPPASDKIVASHSIWTAIHLAGIRRRAPAERAFAFYKKLYGEQGRIPTFLNKDGSLPTEPEFSEVDPPADASPELLARWGTFGGLTQKGDVRTYALLARLAYLLGDRAWGDKMIAEKVLTDQVKDAADERLGAIGVSTAGEGDARTRDVLESLLAIAQQQGATAMGRQDEP